MSPGPIYQSHPGRLLCDHLREVARGARARLDHPALRCRELLREAAYWVGLCHDLGKYTSYFQQYLQTGRRLQGLQYHAFPSAILAAWLIREELPRLPGKEEPLSEFLPLLAYLVVHRHHGHLCAPEVLIPRSRELAGWPQLGRVTGEMRRALEALRHQLEDLDRHRNYLTSELAVLGLPETRLTALPVYQVFGELERLNYRLESGELSEQQGARLCLWGQLLFSALVDADKFSATGLVQPSRRTIPPSLVDMYVQQKFSTPRHILDSIRRDFYDRVQAEVERLELDNLPALSLTAPTGMGKTLVALSAALRLRARLESRWGVPPRIIYVLPFINLIEQNYDVFKKVFMTMPEYLVAPDPFLIRHHHLAEITYHQEDKEKPVEEAMLLTEAWESEVIVTTFVQLFHTLLGYENRFLKKLHNLIGSIVILDEPQSLPMEYWDAVGWLFNILREELGLVPLQMTATRPLIFQNTRELYPNPQQLFFLQRRTRTEVDLNVHSLEELAQETASLAESGPVLVVVNTLRSSLELYSLLKRELGQSWRAFARPPFEGDRALVYLSTNIVPAQRRERLFFLKDWLQQHRPTVVVATQVVEAGVDLDFPLVIRDLGPLEAIVQVAGRCNREGNLPVGRVLLRPLEDPGTGLVYGAVHLSVVRSLLREFTQIEEPEYAALIERYFWEVKARKSTERSKGLREAYAHLWYEWPSEEAGTGRSLSMFRLIPKRPEVPIFVCLSPEEEFWFVKQFIPEVLKAKEFTERHRAYLRYRTRLHEGMIKPLLERARQNLPPAAEGEEGLRWISYTDLNNYYDLESGFRWRPEELTIACCW